MPPYEHLEAGRGLLPLARQNGNGEFDFDLDLPSDTSTSAYSDNHTLLPPEYDASDARTWNDFFRMTSLRKRRAPQPGSDLDHDHATVDRHSALSHFQLRRSWESSSLVRACLLLGLGGWVMWAFVYLINALIALASLVWANDISQIITGWGQPGRFGDGLDSWPTDFSRDILPIPCHSHNDYWRKAPLFSALSAGCTSVEADVWLYPDDDELYVGHSTTSLTRNRTLRSLYVDPLVSILKKQNPTTDFVNATEFGHGVFDTDPGQSLVLLIDVKTSGPETWPHVVRQLEPLRQRGWLTTFNGSAVIPGPITVVGTGNTPFDLLISNTTRRDYFFDAPLDEMYEPESADEHAQIPRPPSPARPLATPSSQGPVAKPLNPRFAGQGKTGTSSLSSPPDYNPTNSLYASTAFGQSIGRMWQGSLTPAQLELIRGQVRGAHRRGLKVRYWDLPGWPISWRNRVWDTLMREGVDVLNVDDLKGAGKGVWTS